MFPDLLVTLSLKEFLVYINIIAQGNPYYVGCLLRQMDMFWNFLYVSDFFVSDRSMADLDYITPMMKEIRLDGTLKESILMKNLSVVDLEEAKSLKVKMTIVMVLKMEL